MEDAFANAIRLLKERRLAQLGYEADIIVTKITEDEEKTEQ